MKRAGGLWPEVASFPRLVRAAYRALRGKRGRADAAEFFRVQPKQLKFAAEKLPWLGRNSEGGGVVYSQRAVALLGAMLEKKIVGREIFSRVPGCPQDAPRRPRKPPAAPKLTARQRYLARLAALSKGEETVPE